MLLDLRRALLVLVAAGACSTVRAVALEPDELFAQLSPSMWTVSTFDQHSRPMGTGSAVVIAPGRLITNCHVVEKGASFSVRRENVRYVATVDLSDPERDLCQLKVANFDAPPVVVAEASTLKVGARVFTIGSPKGFEMTLSDGLLSALRRNEDGSLRYIQTSAPISPGSSGGGLFDQQGRLIGITTMGGRDAQNLNFAVPAQLIAEMAARVAAKVQRDSPVTRSNSATAGEPMGRQRRAGEWFEYRVTDSMTGTGRTLSLSVDRVVGDRVVFNGGSRIEGRAGDVLESSASMLGELDAVSPPGGWADAVQSGAGAGARSLKFTSRLYNGQPVEFDIHATASGEEVIKLDTKEYRAVRIELSGWTKRLPSPGAAHHVPTPYSATVWYAAELNRVVRFSVELRDFTRMLSKREMIELVYAGSR